MPPSGWSWPILMMPTSAYSPSNSARSARATRDRGRRAHRSPRPRAAFARGRAQRPSVASRHQTTDGPIAPPCRVRGSRCSSPTSASALAITAASKASAELRIGDGLTQRARRDVGADRHEHDGLTRRVRNPPAAPGPKSSDGAEQQGFFLAAFAGDKDSLAGHRGLTAVRSASRSRRATRREGLRSVSPGPPPRQSRCGSWSGRAHPW